MRPTQAIILSVLTAAVMLAEVRHAAADDAALVAVLEAEQQRINTVEKISEPAIAIFDSTGQGGGAGVIVSPEGYALTNFHVVAPCGPTMKCGMSDGSFHEAVVVGVDPVGDVALIKLLGGDQYPVAEIGDSDRVRVGDRVFVVGNPFLLANDFTPSVSFGIVSGTHRYQYPAGALLEYNDCIQTDAAINPGNSGGPLFDSRGRLIGVNGRGSFEKRGRVNVGVGYAISINQIQRFMSHLRSGRILDHASLGATVKTTARGRVIVDAVSESSDAYRRGLRYGDELLAFDGREIGSANELQNILGAYPPGWLAPLSYRRGFDLGEITVRLESQHAAGRVPELIEGQMHGPEKKEGERENSDGADRATGDDAKEPVQEEPENWRSLYEERPEFANYYFNKLELNRVLQACPLVATAPSHSAVLVIDAVDAAGGDVAMRLGPTRADLVTGQGRFFYEWEPEGNRDQGLGPPGSGGFLVALRLLRVLMTEGAIGFQDANYVGLLPWGDSRKLHEVISASHDGATAEFYFDAESGALAGLAARYSQRDDFCRVNFTATESKLAEALPEGWIVSHGDARFASFRIESQRYEEP